MQIMAPSTTYVYGRNTPARLMMRSRRCHLIPISLRVHPNFISIKNKSGLASPICRFPARKAFSLVGAQSKALAGGLIPKRLRRLLIIRHPAARKGTAHRSYRRPGLGGGRNRPSRSPSPPTITAHSLGNTERAALAAASGQRSPAPMRTSLTRPLRALYRAYGGTAIWMQPQVDFFETSGRALETGQPPKRRRPQA